MNTNIIGNIMSKYHTDDIKEQAANGLNEIISSLNMIGCEDDIKKALIDNLMNQHRTLQQSFWRCIFNVAKEYGETAVHDLRNEASVDACKEVTKSLLKKGLPFI